MSTKSFLRGRLVDEFNRFTNFIFGNNRFSGNRDTRFETGLSEAVGDYTEARVRPIETKNTEQDNRLSDHDRRIRQLEQLVRNLQAQVRR